MARDDSFYNLTPDVVLRGIEQAGLHPTGEYSQLNSYENRVFDLRLEPEMSPPELRERVIAKFYRPHRWSKDALDDEHVERALHAIDRLVAIRSMNDQFRNE